MSETRGPSKEPTWNGVPEEEEVRRLLTEAGPRPPIAESEIAQIEARAREEWRRRHDFPKRPAAARWPWMLAAAAALVGVGLLWRGRTPPTVTVEPAASVALLNGTAGVETHGEAPVELSGRLVIGKVLPAGSWIETKPESRVALRTGGGASVRLDANTRVRLVHARLLELERGAVYVDTGGVPTGIDDVVAVQTPNGTFLPRGTQFEVRVEPRASATRLRVRQGTVALDDRGPDASAGAGEELTIGSDGRLARGIVPVSGPDWGWVLEAAPMLDIEGVELQVFLDWLAREAGWRVEFADAEAASRADTVLHGSIAHLTPAESPGVVLASCGLAHRLSDGTLVIFLAGSKR